MTKLDDSWNRFPDAKMRLTGDKQLQALVDGLSKNGMMRFYQATMELDQETQGIYITISTNSGKYPEILPVEIDVFIPVPKAMMPKPGKSLEEINEDYRKDLESATGTKITIADDRTVHELKTAQMDVVGDSIGHVDASSTVGGGTNEGPELPEVPDVGERIQPEV